MNNAHAVLNSSTGRVESGLLSRCLRLLVRPIVRYCLRNGLKIQDLQQVIKHEFLEVSREQIEHLGEAVTDSRLSIMSGINRREVVRLRGEGGEPPAGRSLVSRIVGQWLSGGAWSQSAGVPRILGDEEFRELVRSVSQDLNPATVLFELERVRAVIRQPKGLVLQVTSYIPKGNPLAGFGIVCDDSDDLIAAAEQNVFENPALPNHHLRTEYDRIRARDIPEIRRWILQEGRGFHKRARDFLSQFDQDINPDPGYHGKPARVALTSFGRIQGDTDES